MVTFDKFTKAPWNIRLKTIRALCDLTQKELAERCGTSPKIYNNWELGKFKPIKVFQDALSRELGVPKEEIFG